MANWQYRPGSDPNAAVVNTAVLNNFPGIGTSAQHTNPPGFSNYGNIEQGYYVTYPTEPGGRATKENPQGTPMDPANHSPSGYLSLPANKAISKNLPVEAGGEVYLWITQAQISLTMGGSFGQSPRLREFFPRNFVQPVWNIQGIVPNSFQLQRLAEFVRLSHFYALNPTSISQSSSNLLTFHMYAGHLGDFSNIEDKDMDRFTQAQKDYLKQNPNAVQGKGPHAAQTMQGYISNFTRGATRFVNVPTYEFQFTVAFSQGDLIVTQNWGSTFTKSQQDTNIINRGNIGTGQEVNRTPANV